MLKYLFGSRLDKYVQSCLISRLEKSDGEVAVFDATNTTRERRKYLYQRVVLEKGNNFVSSLEGWSGGPEVRGFREVHEVSRGN